MPRGRFRRRRPMTAIVQSVKNQYGVKQSITAMASTTIQFAVAGEVGAPTKVLGFEVPVGAKIFSVTVFINVINSSGTGDGDLDWFIAKARGTQNKQTDFPDPDFTSVGLSDVRNQIFKSSATLFGTEDAGSYGRSFHLKIPKIYQRMRAGDELFLKIQPSINASMSVGFIYKYYM